MTNNLKNAEYLEIIRDEIFSYSKRKKEEAEVNLLKYNLFLKELKDQSEVFLKQFISNVRKNELNITISFQDSQKEYLGQPVQILYEKHPTYSIIKDGIFPKTNIHHHILNSYHLRLDLAIFLENVTEYLIIEEVIITHNDINITFKEIIFN